MQYYLTHQGQIILSDYKKYLTDFFLDKLLKNWKKAGGYQSLIVKSLKIDIGKLFKCYGYSETLLIMINNCAPVCRNLEKDDVNFKCSSCPFCSFGSHDDQYHFYRCPSSIDCAVPVVSLVETTNPVDLFIRKVRNSIKEPFNKLVTILSETYLIETFVTGGVCYVDCCVEEYNLIMKHNPKHFQEDLNVDEFYCRLFSATQATHVMATHWNQIPTEAYGWSLECISPNQFFGQLDLALLTGKITIIYKQLNEKLINYIAKNILATKNKYRPTRVIFVNAKYVHQKCIMIFTNSKFTVHMIENKLSQLLFPCDTTCIERNYNNFTYYSSKCIIRIPNKTDTILKFKMLACADVLKVFDVENFLLMKQVDAPTGFKQILEQCGTEVNHDGLKMLTRVYLRRKLWWKLIIDKLGKRKWGCSDRTMDSEVESCVLRIQA